MKISLYLYEHDLEYIEEDGEDMILVLRRGSVRRNVHVSGGVFEKMVDHYRWSASAHRSRASRMEKRLEAGKG